MPVTVYFATNRQTDRRFDWQSYTADAAGRPGDRSALTCGTAFVSDTVVGDEASGHIDGIGTAKSGTFGPGIRADILGSGRNVLVFLHGFANTFRDGIARAAFNREWLRGSGLSGADTTVVAFCWPSLGRLLAPPPLLAPHYYWADQVQAGRSGPHVADFLAELAPLLDEVRARGRRCFLLAHSMGSFVLQSAVENWFLHGRTAARLFDEVFLAAPDERWDSFDAPLGGRLSRLPELASRIHVYHSRLDVAMMFSPVATLTRRMGLLGPEHRDDPARFPPARFRTVDCEGVHDYPLNHPPDASHQYYRRSARVRADIAAVMHGLPVRPGPCAL